MPRAGDVQTREMRTDEDPRRRRKRRRKAQSDSRVIQNSDTTNSGGRFIVSRRRCVEFFSTLEALAEYPQSGGLCTSVADSLKGELYVASCEFAGLLRAKTLIFLKLNVGAQVECPLCARAVSVP